MWQAQEKVQYHKHKHDMLDILSFIDLFTHLNSNPAGIDGMLSKWPKT